MVAWRRLAALFCVLYLSLAAASPMVAASDGRAHSAERVAEVVRAVDTLNPALPSEPQARAVLEGIVWHPGTFAVQVHRRAESRAHHAVLTFAPPRVGEVVAGGDGVEATGNAESAAPDLVHLRWYAARDDAGEVVEAPAVLLVHSLHPQMIIANFIAQGLASQGVHAFVIEMPGYGHRGVRGEAPAMVALARASQTVAEVRRARDAIAALPEVTGDTIGLQGTSLGGFVAAVAGSVDAAFDPVMLLASGADGYTVLHEGRADAARVRELAYRTGYSDEELRRVLAAVDPLHVAHRLDPTRTWLFSAAADQVIPRRNSDLLAATIGLTAEHHLHIPGDHYTVMLALPELVNRLTGAVRGDAVTASQSEPAR